MPLLYERRGPVAILTLSLPEARNAWCEEYMVGLQQRLPELENDREIRCVILTGDEAGGAFSAGADLKNPRTHTMDSVADFIEALPSRRRSHPIPMLTDFAKPIIAAVNGYAVGIGCIVTYCCDMIVASERADRSSEPSITKIIRIPSRNPKSPRRFVMKAFLAASAAAGRSYQKPMSR